MCICYCYIRGGPGSRLEMVQKGVEGVQKACGSGEKNRAKSGVKAESKQHEYGCADQAPVWLTPIGYIDVVSGNGWCVEKLMAAVQLFLLTALLAGEGGD
jgi:hypothetical protein